MKKKIALVQGGYSSEHEVSVKSAANVYSNIDKNLFDVYNVLLRPDSWSLELDGDVVEIDKSDFSFVNNGSKVKFDLALIMIHGNPGENGLLQAYFELIGLKYTGCSSMVSSLIFDKFACKAFLASTSVNLAKDILLRKGDSFSVKEIIENLGLPLFVKPNDGGSSFGITKVKKEEDLPKAIDDAFNEGETIILEEFISGREMTCGVFAADNKVKALPVTEIISDNEYFDYQAKYLGASKEICPANISSSIFERIQEVTEKIYKYTGCKGIVRMDYIVRGEDVYFLEINPIPGMTNASLVPQQLRVANINIENLFSKLIEEALS